MTAYRHAFFIDANSSDERLELAAEILATGAGVVMFDKTVALRPTPACLLCEVVDPAPTSRRCENEYEVLVENAATRALGSARQFGPDVIFMDVCMPGADVLATTPSALLCRGRRENVG